MARGAEQQQTVAARNGGLGELLRLAWPVVLARLGIMVMGLTDAIVVGRYSSTELGFHALGWAPTSVVLTTAVGLLTGVQVLTARYVGAGRPEATGGVLRRGVVYAFGIGIAAAMMLAALGPTLLRLMQLEAPLAIGAGRVLQVFALSLPAYLVAVACTFYLEALSKPLPGMTAMWAANIINLALNLWLVPGQSGLPVDGAVASAWATFGARTMLALSLITYIVWSPDTRALGIFRKPVDGRHAGVEQRRIGYAAGASYFVEAAAFAGMSIVAGWLGGASVAAWAIVLNVAAIIFMGPLGLASATAVLVGRAYGARDRAGVVRAGLLGFAVCAALTGLVCAIVWPGARLIASAYTTDPALMAIAAGALVLSCLFFVADGLQVVAAQALRARGDVWLPTTTHVISYALFMLPAGWALAHPAGLGVDGIVWAVIIASLLAAGFLLSRFAWLARQPL